MINKENPSELYLLAEKISAESSYCPEKKTMECSYNQVVEQDRLDEMGKHKICALCRSTLLITEEFKLEKP